MRILFVSPRQCWPIASGADLREYHFLRGLAERSELAFTFFQDPAFDLPASSDLPFCKTIVPVARPPIYNAASLVRGLVSRLPLAVVNYTSPQMMQVIERLASATPFDAVHLESTHMAGYLPLIHKLLPRAKVFFDWHNIESEALRRYAEMSPSRLHAMYARVTAGKMERLERDLLGSRYGHFVCSERERKILAPIAPKARVAVIENGVDTTAFPNEMPEGNRILFVGMMAYHANIDGITWFVHDIWPAVREALPGKVLTIVGAKPTPEVLALSKEPGVEVTGTVPDVKPYYREAFAAIAPLRIGAGTRLKILEAMAARVPVISTTIGAEGLDTRPGADILLAETPDDWISGFNRLADRDFRKGLTAAAYDVARRRYDWAIIRSTLFDTFSRWTEDDKA